MLNQICRPSEHAARNDKQRDPRVETGDVKIQEEKKREKKKKKEARNEIGLAQVLLHRSGVDLAIPVRRHTDAEKKSNSPRSPILIDRLLALFARHGRPSAALVMSIV